MRASHATRCEFIRRVYRLADEGHKSRTELLNEVADKALMELEGGKALTSASGGGVSSSYLSFFNIWSAQDRLELVAWARGFISEEDVEDSIALAGGNVTRFSTDFRMAQLRT